VLPAINLSQISEFSLVVLALGLEKHHIAEQSKGMVSFAFVLLATLSTFAMMNSNGLARVMIGSLKRFGVRDLDGLDPAGSQAHASQRASLVAFFRTASSLLEELRRRKQDLLGALAVVDFNYSSMRDAAATRDQGRLRRYQSPGDAASCRRFLAEILISTCLTRCSKGHKREACAPPARNQPRSQDYCRRRCSGRSRIPVCGGRGLRERRKTRRSGSALRGAEAIESNLLDEMRAKLDERLAGRQEVLP
jgi:hypothetical protein